MKGDRHQIKVKSNMQIVKNEISIPGHQSGHGLIMTAFSAVLVETVLLLAKK